MRNARWTGLIWAALALLAWAGWFVVTRFAVTRSTLGPMDLTALRVTGGALLLGPVLLRRRLPPQAWRNGAVLALCWGAPFILVLSYGIRLTSASHSAALVPTLMPVIAGLIGAVRLRRWPPPARLAGYAVVLAGVAALVAAEPSHSLANPAAGTALLLSGSLLWSIYTLRLPGTRLDAMQAASMINVLSTAVFVPLYLLGGQQHLTEAPAREVVAQFAYQGVIVGALSIVAFNKAVAALGPGIAAAIAPLVPVVTVVLAATLLGEWPGPAGATAILTISAGVYLAARPTAAAATRSGPT